MEARIERDGDEYVLNGRKWWTSGAASERCKIAIYMGVSDPDGDPYRRHSMVLVPLETPGVKILRTLPVFGYDIGHGGHCEVLFDDVHVPASNMLGDEGSGFLIAQSRLGPGRIHHCMRALGMAERAFDLMCRRAHERSPFGKSLAQQGVVRNWIAESRIEIEQARLLVLKTAWLMDTAGNQAARIEVSAIKVAAPNVALKVIDRAIQVHGGAGVSDDFPLAAMYAGARTLRIADGPDEVHKLSIARRELRRYQPQEQAPVAT
jgi:acyl-CoA dehydrogenase